MRVACQHKGEIVVESKKGSGTTFRIYLPAVEASEKKEEKRPTKIKMGTGETVLVVEDEEDVLSITRAMLEGLNYNVVEASNGREALEMFDRHESEISVVITDIVMPEMGGNELVQALRERDPHLPVIVMTGYPLDGAEGPKMPEGATSRLDKPFKLDALSAVLDATIKENGG